MRHIPEPEGLLKRLSGSCISEGAEPVDVSRRDLPGHQQGAQPETAVPKEGPQTVDMIDQVLWEQELAEHLNRDTKQGDVLQGHDEEPEELVDLARVYGLEELDDLDDTPRRDFPLEWTHYSPVVVVLLGCLAILVVSGVGWLVGYFLL